jgi:hypothetical protein
MRIVRPQIAGGHKVALVLGGFLLSSPSLPARLLFGLARVSLKVLRIAACVPLSAMRDNRLPHQRLRLVPVEFTGCYGAVQLGPGPHPSSSRLDLR